MCKWVKIILLINSTLIFVLFLKQWQDETVCYGNHVKSSQCAPTVRSFATTQSKVKLSVRDLGCATYQTTASPAWLAKNRPLFVKYRPEIYLFSNFSCRFLNPNYFFQFELQSFYRIGSEKPPVTSWNTFVFE